MHLSAKPLQAQTSHDPRCMDTACPSAAEDKEPALSVIVPAERTESDHGKLEDALRELGCSFEIIPLRRGGPRGSYEGYGTALRRCMKSARGRYVIVLDGSCSLETCSVLWRKRARGAVVLATRFLAGQGRKPRSRIQALLHRMLGRALSIDCTDLTSAVRLYDRRVLERTPTQAKGYDFLLEVLLRIWAEGYEIAEVDYLPTPGAARVRRVRPRLLLDYARTLWKLWKLRNSVASADYDRRAYNSRIPLQRYWQRRRVATILEMTPRQGRLLDVGCGSSALLPGLHGAVGVDISLGKLRFQAKLIGRDKSSGLINADLRALPFADAAFETVVCSQVIEHVPREDSVLNELCRVLAPGGVLVLGTPDYGGWRWPVIEWFYRRLHPWGYADEHVTHYTLEQLKQEMHTRGMSLEQHGYICGAELICRFKKGSNAL